MIDKLISGGQTGADRAALDVAIRHGFPHGGWCPKGRKAEDGPLGGQYNLFETPSASYLQRTEWNVRDTDGTVVFTATYEVSGGSLRTIEFARKHRKPWLHIALGGRHGTVAGGRYTDPAVALQRFIAQHGIKRLNVAGSRGSREPELYRRVTQALEDALFWAENHPRQPGGPGEG